MTDWGDLIKEAKANGVSSTTVPEGNYDAEVVSAKYEPQSGGKHRLTIRYEILNGPFAEEVVADFIHPNLANPKSLGVLLSKLTGTGLSKEFLSGLSSKYGPLTQAPGDHFKLIAAELPGLQCVVRVTEESYQGKPKNNVWAQGPLESAPVAEEVTTTTTTPQENIYAKQAAVNPQMPI